MDTAFGEIKRPRFRKYNKSQFWVAETPKKQITWIVTTPLKGKKSKVTCKNCVEKKTEKTTSTLQNNFNVSLSVKEPQHEKVGTGKNVRQTEGRDTVIGFTVTKCLFTEEMRIPNVKDLSAIIVKIVDENELWLGSRIVEDLGCDNAVIHCRDIFGSRDVDACPENEKGRPQYSSLVPATGRFEIEENMRERNFWSVEAGRTRNEKFTRHLGSFNFKPRKVIRARFFQHRQNWRFADRKILQPIVGR